MTTVRKGALLALALSACGGASSGDPRALPSREATRVASPESPEAPEPSAPNLRALGPTATYSDLVAAARTLDERLEGDGQAGCLLRGSGEAGAAFRLEADLAVAVRPLPDAPENLRERLEGGHAVGVLSRWGRHGATSDGLSLVEVTATPPPTGPATVAIFVTAQGIFLRTTEGPVTAHLGGPFPVGELPSHIAQLTDDVGAGRWVLVAEAAIPLVELRRALATLPPRRPPLSLAVPLTANTAIPEATPPAPDPRLHCPEGPPPEPTGTPEGQLSIHQILSAIEPLTIRARECLAHAQGRAAMGGRLAIHLSVAHDGSVRTACVVESTLNDPTLEACIIEAARVLTFPEPDPKGTVDALLPLHLEPVRQPPQRPLCPR